jgi:hypothetical protein
LESLCDSSRLKRVKKRACVALVLACLLNRLKAIVAADLSLRRTFLVLTSYTFYQQNNKTQFEEFLR